MSDLASLRSLLSRGSARPVASGVLARAFPVAVAAVLLVASTPGGHASLPEHPVPGPSSPGPSGPGTLVIIGGGLDADNEAVYRAILDAREGQGHVCVISTAGADPVGSAASAVARIDRWGGEGTARPYPLSEQEPAAARDPDLLVALSECAGFYFTGGSQSRILNLFRPEGEFTPAAEVIRARWQAGAVVSGSSAGAAMMSDPMIAGGTSAGAFLHGIGEGGVRLDRGMGFLPDLLVDQHFLARGRIGRLLVAAGAPDGMRVGAGIDEDTALIVRGRELEVVGTSGVVLVDGRSTGSAGAQSGSQAANELRVELLGPGDHMSLDEWTVRPAPGKTSIAGTAAGEGMARTDGMADTPDLFERWAFLHSVEAMGRGTDGSSEHAVEGGRIMVRQGANFRALASPGHDSTGPDGSAYGLSAGPFLVRIHLNDAGDPRR